MLYGSFNIQYSTSWICHPFFSFWLFVFFAPIFFVRDFCQNTFMETLNGAIKKFTSIDWFSWLLALGERFYIVQMKGDSSIIQTGFYESEMLSLLSDQFPRCVVVTFYCKGQNTAELFLCHVTRQKSFLNAFHN